MTTSRSNIMKSIFLAATMLASGSVAWAGQAPGALSAPDIPVSHHDRVYAAEQFSNTVSVTDPVDNKLLGVIRLGDPQPGNFSPLYKGQVLVHGMGFSPDHKTLAVISIGSNSVTFIDTATNAIKHMTYVGRSPHEAFFTPDQKEVWVAVRGENYIDVLDGKKGYVCSSFTPETVVIETASHKIVGHVKQDSPFCPDIAATPDGKQVWFTLKDTGKVMVFNARPPFAVEKTIDTGPITNHVNIVRNSKGQFAYVTIGGLNMIKVFRTDNFEQVATIDTGALPHGLWPSGDGTRVYVGLENADHAAAIDTLENKVIAEIPIGQAPQGVAYIPNAVPDGDGTSNLQPLAVAAESAQLKLAPSGGKAVTQVSLFNQGLVQVLQAAVTGLEPKKAYTLALSEKADGGGTLQPLAAFMTNPAGAAIVDTVGPIRQLVEAKQDDVRRYLVIAPGATNELGAAVQVQMP